MSCVCVCAVFEHPLLLCSIAVIGLAMSHPIIRYQKSVSSCAWCIGADNQQASTSTSSVALLSVRGKRKKGSISLSSCTVPLCKLTCSDGSVYTIIVAVKGKLIELNESLSSTCAQLSSSTLSQWSAYIAIVHLSAQHLSVLQHCGDAHYATEATWKQKRKDISAK